MAFFTSRRRCLIALTIVALVATGSIYLRRSTAEPADTQPTMPQSDSPAVVLREYDITEFLLSVPDFANSPESDSSTVVHGSSGGGALFGGAGMRETRGDRNAMLTGLTDLIKTIDPTNWRDAGGDIGTIKEFRGVLYIQATAEDQAKIAELLKRCRQHLLLSVHIRADWIVAHKDEMQAALHPYAVAGGKGESTPFEELDSRDLVKFPHRYGADLVCLNGQRATVSIAASSLDQAHTELALDVENALNLDKTSASLTIRNQVLFQDQATARPTTQPSTMPAAPAPQMIQTLSTSVHIPLGHSILVGGISVDRDNREANPAELFLLIRVTAE